MSKYKIGDEVVLVASNGNPSILKNGVTGVVLDIDTSPYVQFNIEKSDELNNARGLGEDGKCWAVSENEIELIKPKSTPSFKTSNRYKLHKYILSTGFTKQDLSLALNRNQSYLATETRESQFTNRGDMSEARYKSLRKQIKEAVQIKSSPVDISIVSAEINQTLAEVEPKEKDTSFVGCSWSELSNTFDYQPNQKQEEKTLDEKVKEAKEALDTFTTPKPSNNGAFILGLVFFAMLIIFGIGFLIYKAA